MNTQKKSQSKKAKAQEVTSEAQAEEQNLHESVDRPSSVSNPGSVPGIHPRA